MNRRVNAPLDTTRFLPYHCLVYDGQVRLILDQAPAHPKETPLHTQENQYFAEHNVVRHSARAQENATFPSTNQR